MARPDSISLTPCSEPIESLMEKRFIPSTRRSASISSAQMSVDPSGFRQCPLEVLYKEGDVALGRQPGFWVVKINMAWRPHAAAASAPPTKRQRVINGLVSYTRIHFVNEERFFDQHGYPNAPAHKQEHAKFIFKVKAFQDDFERGKLTLSLDIMNFLSDWLTSATG